MLAGPIFTREALTAPRHPAHFLLRAGYVGTLFVLTYTASQATFGWQSGIAMGELARFGTLLFQLFSFVQLALVLFFSPLFAASRIAQEKDRQTLILLLMTDLTNREMVLGKLFAALLPAGVLLLISLPVMTSVYLLGGVSLTQIAWSIAIAAATSLAAGSWGTLVAFWRENTFQTLAISLLGVVLYFGVVEAAVELLWQVPPAQQLVSFLSPLRALVLVLDPLAAQPALRVESVPAWPYVLALLGVSLLLNLYTIAMLRVWNPTRTLYVASKTAEEAKERAASRTRHIWDNPVLWREVCTRAYGRRMVFIKLGYLLLFGFAAYLAWVSLSGGATGRVLGMISTYGAAFVAAAFVSLLLVNAQAVTALTSERDAKTLELLLVTDISAREFVFGKLGGILWNMKEVVVLPLLGLLYFWVRGAVDLESLIYLTTGLAVLIGFSAMLGLHYGLAFDSSRAAITNSLGTMFFLFLGILVCMLLIVEARSSFLAQLPSFVVFIVGGSIGLGAVLTRKNPSNALWLAAWLLPFFTFYAITEFLLNGTLGVWLAITATYGFTTIAMLVPAVSEFDVALGRSTIDKG